MRYFECKVKLTNEIQPRTDEGSAVCDEIARKCDEYCDRNKDSFCGCVTYLKGRECVFYMSGNGSNAVFEAEIKNFWKMLKLKGKIEKISEMPVDKVNKALRNSRHVDTPDDIEELMKVEPFRYTDIDEHIVTADGKPDLAEYADFIRMPELKAEAERIAACNNTEFIGHPVHYLIEGNDIDKTKKTVDVLVSSLMKVNRLESGRVSYIDEKRFVHERKSLIENIYDNIGGGTVLVGINTIRGENEYADTTDAMIEEVCRHALKHRNDILTIFNITRHDVKAENAIASYLKDELRLVQLREAAIGFKDCISYLGELAAEKDIHNTGELEKKLDPNTETYYISELDKIFNEYYNEHIRNTAFPAYADCNVFKAKESKIEGKAADELAEMIGLDSVKDVINRSVNFFRLQQAYRDRNIVMDNPARSMIFTGNPGTAKTTVARLTAKIFRDNGLLANGRLVEVGRADLVGKFVGWTAPTIKAAFRKAKGSILFIDEAYSLVDDRDGSFGDEAINTIVQEMENHRDDTIVIFAGYPDKMEGFLAKNPGLRSRIAFHVDFPDYKENELLDILRLMVKNKNMKLAGDAEDKAREIFREAVKLHDFGNGRFVRNLLESAVMGMSQRLAGQDLNKLSDEMLVTLTADDFTMPKLTAQKDDSRRKIGF